jgi:peroxiredoxin
MKALRSLLIFLCVLSLGGCGVLGVKGKQLIGQPAPDARLMLLDGTEFPLSAQQGRYCVLVFWATWCKHSKTAIAEYEELARRYSQHQDIDFYAISVDKNENFGTLKDRIKAQDLRTMTHIFSGNDTQDDAFLNYQGDSIPYAVVIDKQGIVRFVDSSISSLDEYLKLEFGY